MLGTGGFGIWLNHGSAYADKPRATELKSLSKATSGHSEPLNYNRLTEARGSLRLPLEDRTADIDATLRHSRPQHAERVCRLHH